MPALLCPRGLTRRKIFRQRSVNNADARCDAKQSSLCTRNFRHNLTLKPRARARARVRATIYAKIACDRDAMPIKTAKKSLPRAANLPITSPRIFYPQPPPLRPSFPPPLSSSLYTASLIPVKRPRSLLPPLSPGLAGRRAFPPVKRRACLPGFRSIANIAAGGWGWGTGSGQPMVFDHLEPRLLCGLLRDCCPCNGSCRINAGESPLRGGDSGG
jgi:hypothetical protein